MGAPDTTSCCVARPVWPIPHAATSRALQLAATDLEYEGTRVKSPVLGRDMNPMGRGDGTFYCNGGNSMGSSIAVYGAKPSFLGEVTSGYGSSVNNRGRGFVPPPPGDLVFGRVNRASQICPVMMAYCVMLVPLEHDPCEGMDLSDTWVFCCQCIPAMCGLGGVDECHGFTPCLYYPKEGYYEYCAGRDYGEGEESGDLKTRLEDAIRECVREALGDAISAEDIAHFIACIHDNIGFTISVYCQAEVMRCLKGISMLVAMCAEPHKEIFDALDKITECVQTKMGW